MSVIIGILLNTLLIAGMIVWLSRGGNQWINTLNATSLSTCISLFVIMETAGAVMGIFIWAHVTGHPDPLDKSLGYLGIWFGFLGTHVLVNSGTQIAKRTTDGTYVEKKGAAKAAVEAAKASVIAGPGGNGMLTAEHPAPAPVVVVKTTTEGAAETEVKVADGNRPTTPTIPVPEPTEHEWATGEDKQAGVL